MNYNPQVLKIVLIWRLLLRFLLLLQNKMPLSASTSVTSHINKNNQMYFGNNRHWTCIYFEMDTDLWECDPVSTQTREADDSKEQYPFSLCAWKYHYSEWFATRSHSWLYFFHHEVTFFVRKQLFLPNIFLALHSICFCVKRLLRKVRSQFVCKGLIYTSFLSWRNHKTTTDVQNFVMFTT